MGVSAVLAIDAGNSKTDVALVAADGRLLGRAQGPGFRPMGEGGAPESVEALAPIVAEAVADCATAGRPVAALVSAYLANVDLPEEEAEAHALLAARGWGTETVVGNDTLALLRAGTDRPEGVAVVCGAGVNAVGLRADGAVARFPSLGELTGDWGGGGGLGTRAMFHAVRGEDGRGPRTALSAAIAAWFGTATAQEAAIGVHLGRLPRERLWRFSPELFRAAEAGDAVAGELVAHQAREVVAMALSCLRRLSLVEREVVVVLGGGVLAAGHPLLLGPVRAALAAEAPRAVLRMADTAPVVGAALLGLDRLGATPAAEASLRAEWRRAAAHA
ncbi:hypothetical protein BIV57_08345 [Mangrovactinospora gilvigrisea]|uniref:ATPase BadF/BadG/BcrA/BcrD type domain-containing protein n=1 Tax=Mangrovactinospora gilvigrisea TaxID=1428644 RepID=A0A1J7BWT8_9ACTN|nr:BadF/BadG/BcrA/BcrD ATPase family protein [Mangrovactinospora gilvigrisea]OIV37937.1 hypothetical protein BIV57_08345 [Mangrovactinospora gilvigrisea]